jgi:hypothetical protein
MEEYILYGYHFKEHRTQLIIIVTSFTDYRWGPINE